MADWRDIPNESIEPDAPVRSIDGFALRDNPIAIAEGAAGAPRVASGALKTAQATTTIGINGSWPSGGGSVTQVVTGTLSGGQFAFLAETDYEAINNGSTDLVNMAESHWGNRRTGTSNQGFALRCWGNFTAEAGGSASGATYRTQVTFRVRYFQSSPPYNHGDGDVFGYVYAAITADGSVVSLYVSEDPPWYGNTSHAPDRQWTDGTSGKSFQIKKTPVVALADVDSGKSTMDEYIENAGKYNEVVEEITNEVKLRGMEDMPCPFDAPEGGKVVMLDPMNKCISSLISIMQSGESVKSLFDSGRIKISDNEIKRSGPPGVEIHSFEWVK